MYVQLAPHEEPGDHPLHCLGDARGLLGHESLVPFPGTEDHPAFELGVAAVLREDLDEAGPDEADRAILGYTILNGWSASDERRPWTARRVPAQLGPLLVTPDETGDLGRLRGQARIEGQVVADAAMGGSTFSLPASIAWLSRWMTLRAGDVIGAGRVRGGRGEVPYGAATDLLVERMGKLAGRPVRRQAP
jgi:2-keto-4-pentenoate hydratase/2-oxohepta-3-ene-1,7-dioic acid hydratase in catechol pathway